MISAFIAASLTQQKAIAERITMLRQVNHAMRRACYDLQFATAVDLFEKSIDTLLGIVFDVLDNFDTSFVGTTCVVDRNPMTIMKELVTDHAASMLVDESDILFHELASQATESHEDANADANAMELLPLGIEPKLVIPEPKLVVPATCGDVSPASLLVRLTNKRMKLSHTLLYLIITFRRFPAWAADAPYVARRVLDAVHDIFDMLSRTDTVIDNDSVQCLKDIWLQTRDVMFPTPQIVTDRSNDDDDDDVAGCAFRPESDIILHNHRKVIPVA